MKNSSFLQQQKVRNDELIKGSPYMREKHTSEVLPFHLDLSHIDKLNRDQISLMNALGKEAATIALSTLASLAEINELDHLGGGLDLIPALMMTMAIVDFEKKHYTIEHAHTSIGYYSTLATLGYLDRDLVINKFRRGLDMAGHVSWVPGGTELNGGRLGVMVPMAVGMALGLKVFHGEDSFVICHCGDAGWISGQALNGFNGADLHKAPATFVMHRNGIQLSNTTRNVMDKDPRPIISAMGIHVLEIPSLADTANLFMAYREAYQLAQKGRPSLIYPTGYPRETLASFGDRYGISEMVENFSASKQVKLDTPIWVPGSLMSYRDVIPMLECLFLVNGLEGGAAHHDGHMKGRDLEQTLDNPMLQLTPEEKQVLEKLRTAPTEKITTRARPSPGAPNLMLSKENLTEISLPDPGKNMSARAGSQAAYAAVAQTWPDQFFNVCCDLSPSTKLDKANALLEEDHIFEMSIEEQAAALMANGLSLSSRQPQLNVFSTFAAFFEGIAREGFEVWRYHRNLNGKNEGLNVTLHLSHVGACTGRDHFSGWSLDWIALSMGYLPYLDRFYAPADARAAFIAVKDLASRYGAHIIGIPRDNVPILTDQDGKPLWDQYNDWEPITKFRKGKDATRAILAFGCTAYLAEEAFEELQNIDVYVINGLPFNENQLDDLIKRYPDGMVTIEDGLIASPEEGLRGFASILQSATTELNYPLAHVGITDPTIAPSHGFKETWEHFGLTASALMDAVKSL